MNSTNHKEDCPGTFVYSGSGYNRVRVCDCGAEDHAPEDLFPHKREPFPYFSLDLVDYVLIFGLFAAVIWWWWFVMYA